MKKSIYLFIIFAVVVIFFRQFFLHGLLPIPSDALVGLYNPFRDVFAQQYPRGIPFKNFLITDPIRQIYPWKELAISLEKNFQLPLWNPYSFSGYPLLANFQSSSLYPLNIIFFFLPFSLAWSMLVFLQPLLAGIFLYFYLRNLKLHPLASLLGSLAFAFSGFSIAWLEWNTILQTLLWIPLVLLAKDKLIEKWTVKWMLVFFFAEVAAFLAGHLQILFYGLCITNVYLFIRVFQKTKRQKGNLISSFVKIYTPFFLVGLVMFVVTSLQWGPTLQFIFYSARSVDVNYLTTEGWFVPWQHLIQFLVPDFFGNPTTLNYWGVWNYGEFVGYIGVLPVIFSLIAILGRHDKKTYFFGGLTLIALLFALPTSLAQLPYSLHIPLLSTSQPTRLMGIVDLALSILAALGLDFFIKNKKTNWSLGSVIAIIGICYIFLWGFIFKLHPILFSSINLSVAKSNLIFPTAIFASSVIILVLFALFRKKMPFKVQVLIIAVLILITVVDQLRFAEKFTPFTSKTYLYPNTSSLSFLQQNIGNYRVMTTDSQILPPNVSVMYRLQSIEGYDPLYIDRYGAFIAAMQRNKPDISSPYGFNRIVVPHDSTSPFVNLLGVKYVLSFGDLDNSQFTKVFQEGQTKIYENTQVLRRAFFVKNVVYALSKQDAIEKMFVYKKDLNNTAIVENKLSDTFGTGSVQIISYKPNSITIKTENSNDGFLVLTDVYYPIWHVKIDGKESPIILTDFTFRGVVVPSGKHNVVFSDQLF